MTARVSIPQSEFDGLGLSGTFEEGAPWYEVSIPQSEFDGLGRVIPFALQFAEEGVSIPQSEFDGLGPGMWRSFRGMSHWFQFPSRNSMDWDSRHDGKNVERNSTFQFPSRNSMDWDMGVEKEKGGAR